MLSICSDLNAWPLYNFYSCHEILPSMSRDPLLEKKTLSTKILKYKLFPHKILQDKYLREKQFLGISSFSSKRVLWSRHLTGLWGIYSHNFRMKLPKTLENIDFFWSEFRP